MSLVSVITPLYNSHKYISEAIGSVLGQSYENWEMIIVDDFSSDGSSEVVESFSSDKRIRLIKLPHNSGAAVARNTAIDAARGRYIAFLDSDDLWLPEKLETQVPFMNTRDAALSYSAYERITYDGSRTGEITVPPVRLTYKKMLKSNQIGCLTAMYDVEKVGKVYMPLIRKRQDYGLWLKILKSVPYAEGISKTLALYRVRSESISSNKAEMLKYNWAVYREFEGFSAMKSAYYLGWNVARKVLK